MLTGRDAAHKRIADMLAKGEKLPVDFTNRVIYYVGPVDPVRDEVVGPAGPTTATRMDKFTRMMLEQTGLISMIGKSERGPVAIEAIKDNKSAYLMAVGGAAYLVAKAIKSAKVVGFADLGMEAIYEFDVENMPVTVAVDSSGTSVHEHRPEGMAGQDRQDSGHQGIRIVTGYPGGAILPIYDALGQSTVIRHVLARHEQGAGFIAQGMARVSGLPAVCLASSGPGATNLLTAIADAKLDSIPLVAITGQVPRAMIGTDAFQEVDTYGLTIPITKHNFLVTSAEELLGSHSPCLPDCRLGPARTGSDRHPEGCADSGNRDQSLARTWRRPPRPGHNH
jgi:tartrate/fumarate subfamily iron-sulfur-dependent hydro-lyase beta chain